MTADDRERRGNELRSKLEKLERKDAALTVAALESDIPGITFRADLSVPALLSVRALREPARTALVA